MAALLAGGECSSLDLARSCLERLKETDPQLGAFLTVCEEEALAAAQVSDTLRKEGKTRSPVEGLPYALKDNILTRGVRTTCASRMLAGYLPAEDATVTAKLNAAGAVLLGKTNLDEFAMGATDQNSAFRPVHNPWDLELVPGGSSGGSAAAVAAGHVPLALGSDTGGSARLPASYCGLVGLKPTYGRISRYGVVAYASSLDQVGLMTRNVLDAAMLLEILAGRDDRDPRCSNRPVEPYTELVRAAGAELHGVTLGVPTNFLDVLDDPIRTAFETVRQTLRELGAREVAVELPLSELALETYLVLSNVEASGNLARFDGVRFGHRAPRSLDLDTLQRRSRSYGLGHEVKTRLMLGTFLQLDERGKSLIDQASRVRTLISRELDAALCRADVLLTPPTSVLPAKLGPPGEARERSYRRDNFVCPANLGGLPALVLPCAAPLHGTPQGFQFIGKPFSEAMLLKLGQAVQLATGWCDLLAPL